MDTKPTISLGAKVFIYTVSFTFDFMTLFFTIGLSLFGFSISWTGIGLGYPIVAILLNKFITIFAFFVFLIIYQFLGISFGSKLQKLILKKAFKKFLWPWLIKIMPLAGWLPMIILSNWLLIRVVKRYDKKQAQRSEEELLEKSGGYI